MVKLIFFCRRRRDITHVRYAQSLLEGHVPLALQHHPLMRRYVVNIVEQSPGGWDDLDSIGELGFDSLDDFRHRLYDSAEGQRIIERDVAAFMGGAYAYATTQHLQRGVPRAASGGTRSAGVKLVCPIVRRPGMSHADFVEHWLGSHVPLALRHHPGMSVYVTNVVDARLTPGAPDIDGIAELHFSSPDAFAAGLYDSPRGAEVIRRDIGRFIGRTAAYRVAEYVQKS
jgi:uncharacterized protein (TIGR02118 family)